jgi:uncharacterized protein YeaO (DUF488 family)
LTADIEIARVYRLEKRDDGYYVLVDRLWPRGVARATAPFDEWLKDVAPSAELRKWYGHDPGRFEEFAVRYRQELGTRPACDAFQTLHHHAESGRLVLLTASKNLAQSEAAVLQTLLCGR